MGNPAPGVGWISWMKFLPGFIYIYIYWGAFGGHHLGQDSCPPTVCEGVSRYNSWPYETEKKKGYGFPSS